MRTITAVLVCLAIGLPAFATEANPSKRQEELVKELLVVSKADVQAQAGADAMLGQMEEQFIAIFSGGSDDAAEIEDAKAAYARFRELVREKIDYKQLTNDIYTRLYAKYFTEKELEDLVAFYKTSTGRKSITVLPAMMNEAVAEAGKRSEAMMLPIIEQVEAEREKRRPWRRTMSDIRTIATVMEPYATDENEYPRVSDIAALRKLTEPVYVKKLPEKDVWGNAYAVVVSPDGQHYRVVSAGADGVFEWDSRRIVVLKEGEEPQTRHTVRPEDDIVFADGAFVQFPKVAAPKEEE